MVHVAGAYLLHFFQKQSDSLLSCFHSCVLYSGTSEKQHFFCNSDVVGMSLHSAFRKDMLLSMFCREAWPFKASASKQLRALTCPTTHCILYFHLISLPQLPWPARCLYFASNPPARQFAYILLSDFHFSYFSANFRPISWQLTTELAPELSLVNFLSLMDHPRPGSGSL